MYTHSAMHLQNKHYDYTILHYVFVYAYDKL